MSLAGQFEKEAERARYVLRSSFFYDKRKDWQRWCHLVETLSGKEVNWENKRQLGISEDAWSSISEKGAPPIFVFCHPDIISQEPTVIAYYRCLALLPQKGGQRLYIGTTGLEKGRARRLSSARLEKIVVTLNGLISVLVEMDPRWSLEGARTAALLNMGAGTNGSWRNAIGKEGSRRVKELFVGGLIAEGVVTEVVLKDGSALRPNQELPDFADIKEFRTVTGYLVTFASEPDISVRDASGALKATVEVKYGLDYAGALERYGAAKKSFEQATRENRRVVNIYLPAIITPELRRRIDDDRLVNQDFNLIQVLSQGESRQKFLKFFKTLIGL